MEANYSPLARRQILSDWRLGQSICWILISAFNGRFFSEFAGLVLSARQRNVWMVAMVAVHRTFQPPHSANRHDAGCGGAGCGSLRDKQITMPVNNSAANSSNSAMISLYCDLCCGYPKR